jgi:solute carrier family 13 (sodium-dependent dicarboxylate transporter), member 2/3/5
VSSSSGGLRQRIGFWLGLALFALVLSVSPPEGLTREGWATAAVAALMATWWFTEPVPIAFTGSLPFLLLPLLEIATPAAVASRYMSPVLFLVLGGAMLGLALERWGMHRRVALAVVSRTAPEPRRLLFALMAVTALTSMWVSNTATVVMMLPIALATALAVTGKGLLDAERLRYTAAMVLGIPVAANIGGIATPIGTPVNPVAIGIVEQQFGVRLGFLEWMAFGVPIVLLALPAAWWVLSRVTLRFTLPTAERADVLAAIGETGASWTTAERRLVVVLAATVAAWIFLPLLRAFLPALTDSAIAMFAALALCVIPAGERHADGRSAMLLEWEDARRAPWYLILLLGGGLALADAVMSTGLSTWIGAAVAGLSAAPLLILLLMIAALCVLVSECASNLATAATFMPIAAALAIAGGHEPIAAALTAGIAASWVFANPAGTAANALAIGTGRVPVPALIRNGLAVDLIGAVLIALVCGLVVPRVV